MGVNVQRDHYRRLSVFAGHLSGNRHQVWCGQPVPKGAAGSSREVLTTLSTCKRKWHCLPCACTAASAGAKSLRHNIQRWIWLGGDIAFLTLTQSHTTADPLAELWDRLSRGWGTVTSGKQWTNVRDSFGIRGHVRVTEVVHRPDTGWNVHYHVVIFIDRGLGPNAELEQMRVAIARRFLQGVAEAGGTGTLAGQDIRPFMPGTAAQLADYCFKGLKVQRFADNDPTDRPRSRTPMAILEDLSGTGESHELWTEFAEASVGRNQKSESRHLDRITPSAPTSLISNGINSTPSRGPHPERGAARPLRLHQRTSPALTRASWHETMRYVNRRITPAKTFLHQCEG